MSPRRNHPRRDAAAKPADPEAIDLDRVRRVEAVETSADGQWRVRTVTAASAVKAYRCPGCDHEIRPGVAHVVAWPSDERGDLTDRRHWHTGCWRGRERRAPIIQRSRSAPRYG